eukprot:6213330-Pleurochrysis_carterae.AAC.1
MAKSELLTASMPSFPMMPTPMWPALIMATSLAPSPIARQHDPGTPNLIMLSICAFWSLRARHATTARHELDTAVSTSPQTVAQYSIPFSSITMHGTSLPSGATCARERRIAASRPRMPPLRTRACLLARAGAQLPRGTCGWLRVRATIITLQLTCASVR